jgi:glutaredoxin
MKNIVALLLAMHLLLLPLCSNAQIYKWIDANGKVHFGDAKNRPMGEQTERLNIEINTYSTPTIEVASGKTDTIIMYSAAWCGYCKKAKSYFMANSIPFTEYDIDKDKAAKRRHKKMGATGVPVILYKDKRMNGFSESGFKRIYDPPA